MNNKSWIQDLNEYGKKQKPCFFIIDFSAEYGEVYSLKDLKKENIEFNFPQNKTTTEFNSSNSKIKLTKHKIDYSSYKKSFENVIKHLQRGNSYLVNLTCETPIDINIDLEELFHRSKAKYKIKYRNNWVCFSPESFVRIDDNKISTYPMKGTISADVINAENILRNDIKEKAEHSTIVDLLRNDLSTIAKRVRVENFMYIDKINTNQGDILQMSSEITGNLEENWHLSLGDILSRLLPAGSITGAPKKKTIEIIKESENHDRGFYTGIAGYYDGKCLDSCVLIRFVERKNIGLVYKSGGGITTMSDVKKEYEELNQKIYVPIH